MNLLKTWIACIALASNSMAFSQAALPRVDAEVRDVDSAARTITLAHGNIGNVDMPAMTMTFRVKDATLLDHVKTGDKVRFSADKVDGLITVVAIEPPN
ncbi:MAG: copper-binding protein [Variovorax sp.]|nr:copper-binding protein [Variovorax sp.]